MKGFNGLPPRAVVTLLGAGILTSVSRGGDSLSAVNRPVLGLNAVPFCIISCILSATASSISS